MLATDSNESQDPMQGASAVQTPRATSRRRWLVWAVVGLVLRLRARLARLRSHRPEAVHVLP